MAATLDASGERRKRSAPGLPIFTPAQRFAMAVSTSILLRFTTYPGDNVMRKNLLISAALFAGLGLSAAAFAGPHGDGHHGRGRPGGAFGHELRDVGLTDEQKATIKGFFEQGREQGKDSRKTLRDLRRAFEVAAPGSAAYSDAARQLAEAEASEARSRVQHQAELRTRIYGVLTPEQRTKLAQELANRKERPAPPPKS